MATLTSQQLKDSYQSLVTIGDSITSDPTSGQLENGKGTPLTAVGIGTDSPDSLLHLSASNSGANNNNTLRFTDTDATTQANQSLGRIEFESQDSNNPGVNVLIDAISEGTGGTGALILGTGAGSSTERMRINSGGDISFRDGATNEAFYWDASTARLGIGTTSPEYELHTYGFVGISDDNDTARYRFIVDDDGTDARFRIRQERANGANSAINNLTIVGGNVGIGTTSPDTILELDGGTSYEHLKISASGNTSRFMKIGMDGATEHTIEANGASSFLTFKTGSTPTEKMRIDSNGNVLVGTTVDVPNFTPNLRFVSVADSADIAGSFVNDTAATQTMVVLNQDTSGTRILVDFRTGSGNGTSNGQITSDGTNVSYGTTSDYRLKENVVPIEGALNKVEQLKPSRFNFITNVDKTVDGFLAHEVAEIVPEAVTGEKDAVDEEGNPIYQGIDHSKLVPLLVGAIQELKAEIEQLKAK